jgi:[DsrC]-trisulfide reductase subunit J
VRLLAALALIAALTVPAGVLAGVDKPILEKASRGPCIAPPEVMRREHPDMLKHQRTVTVHQGVVDANVSLEKCVACHASKTTGSVAASPQDFCESCHAYAGVRLDCFECHASRPEKK